MKPTRYQQKFSINAEDVRADPSSLAAPCNWEVGGRANRWMLRIFILQNEALKSGLLHRSLWIEDVLRFKARKAAINVSRYIDIQMLTNMYVGRKINREIGR
jgi:hypothetical protein